MPTTTSEAPIVMTASRVPEPEGFEPGFDRLLVKLVPEFANAESSGEHGKKVLIPQEAFEAQKRPIIGEIVRAGWECHEKFIPGRYVCLKHFVGQPIPLPSHRKDELGMWVTVPDVECLGIWEAPVFAEIETEEIDLGLPVAEEEEAGGDPPSEEGEG